MKLPRDLFGRELADHLVRHWDYIEERQAGSHIILRTEVRQDKLFQFLHTSL